MIISAEFSERRAAGPAILALKKLGVDGEQIDVYSATPVEFAPGVLDRSSRMSFIGVAGGIAAGSAVTAFIAYTQLDYPLVTGGMPLTSNWATAVVTFEVTMLGAILATAAMFLKESGLLSSRKGPPAPVVEGDEVVIRLTCTGEQADAAQSLLRETGAVGVGAIEEAV